MVNGRIVNRGMRCSVSSSYTSSSCRRRHMHSDYCCGQTLQYVMLTTCTSKRLNDVSCRRARHMCAQARIIRCIQVHACTYACSRQSQGASSRRTGRLLLPPAASHACRSVQIRETQMQTCCGRSAPHTSHLYQQQSLRQPWRTPVRHGTRWGPHRVGAVG
jgi:hypothetical protein